MIPNLFGKVVIVTGMKKLPKCCTFCRYYDSMGGTRGYRNSGACVIQNFRSTEDIQVSKMRLDTCPLRLVKRKKQSIEADKAIAWLKFLRGTMRDADCREALEFAVHALETQIEEGTP